MQGLVVKDGVIFDERIRMGQIVQKRVVQNPLVQGLMVQGRCIIAHRYGDELCDRKRPQEVNPLLTYNASLTLRMTCL